LQSLLVRKADVIELDLIESFLRCFHRKSNVVIPRGPVERIGPREALTIYEQFSLRRFDGQIRSYTRNQVVLEDDDSGDGVHTTAVQIRNESNGIADCHDPVCTGYNSQCRMRGMTDETPISLDVDHDRIQMHLAHGIEDPSPK